MLQLPLFSCLPRLRRPFLNDLRWRRCFFVETGIENWNVTVSTNQMRNNRTATSLEFSRALGWSLVCTIVLIGYFQCGTSFRLAAMINFILI